MTARCAAWWCQRRAPAEVFPDSAENVVAAEAAEPEPAPTAAALPDGRAIPIRHHDQATPPSAPEIDLRAKSAPANQSEADRFADYELPALTLLEEPEPFPTTATTSTCATPRRCSKRRSRTSA